MTLPSHRSTALFPHDCRARRRGLSLFHMFGEIRKVYGVRAPSAWGRQSWSAWRSEWQASCFLTRAPPHCSPEILLQCTGIPPSTSGPLLLSGVAATRPLPAIRSCLSAARLRFYTTLQSCLLFGRHRARAADRFSTADVGGLHLC